MIFKNGYKITQFFGNNPNYYKQFGFAGHEGLDVIPAIRGDNEIYCIEDGEVLRDIDDPKSGAYGIYTVVWNSTTRRAWWYCHLAQNFVETRKKVRKGEKMGVMGATGNTFGAHLHLNLRLSDTNANPINTNNGYKGFVDPLPVLNQLSENMADTVTVDKTAYEKLIRNASIKEEVARYLDIVNPDLASYDDYVRVIGGLKSRITDLQNQIGSRDADIKNKDEQISRLKGDLLNRDKLIQELQDSNKPYLERIKYLEGELEAMATSKGAVVTELEKCKAQSPIEELTIGDVLILLFKKISPIKLK